MQMQNPVSILKRGSRHPTVACQINHDPDPVVVRKRSKLGLEYTQEFSVRYLKPPTPPPPGDIIINEIECAPCSRAPSLIVRQVPPRPQTPPPIVIREVPPTPPPAKPAQIIQVKKEVPPPPRKLIIERLPALPHKPRPIIIERWLPYKKQKRRVVYKKTCNVNSSCAKPRNLIIEWDSPKVNIRQDVKYLGIIRADPKKYVERFGLDSLQKSSELSKFVRDIPTPRGLILAADHAWPNECYYDLYGDLYALELIDLNKEGLGEYRHYLCKPNITAKFSRVQQPLATLLSKKITSAPNELPHLNTKHNLAEIIERTLLAIGYEHHNKISISDVEQLYLMLNARMGRLVTDDTLTEFFSLFDFDWDGSVDLDEFKRAFMSTI